MHATFQKRALMSTTLSSAELDPRRRRTLFRAWHRGTKENDLICGRFADAELPHMSDADLTTFELLMEVPDRDIFAWVTGKAPVPSNYDTPVFRRLVAMHLG
jgi:antitoxin CptB